MRTRNVATGADHHWAKTWLGALLGLAMSPAIASESSPACHPRLLTEFRSTLASAAEQGNYSLLREAFGQGLEDLVGLTCDIGSLEGILRDAGFVDVGRVSYEGGRVEVAGYLQVGLFARLLGGRYRALARIGTLDGSTQHFSIGPIK